MSAMSRTCLVSPSLRFILIQLIARPPLVFAARDLDARPRAVY
jgi:hypothetical protein